MALAIFFGLPVAVGSIFGLNAMLLRKPSTQEAQTSATAPAAQMPETLSLEDLEQIGLADD